MKRILSRIPYLHSKSDLDLRFGAENLWGHPDKSSDLKLHPFFSKVLGKVFESSSNKTILAGTPNQFLNEAKCTNCAMCLAGCPYGALFDPGDEINKLIYSGKLPLSNILKGKVVRIIRNKDSSIVEYASKGKTSEEEFLKEIEKIVKEVK